MLQEHANEIRSIEDQILVLKEKLASLRQTAKAEEQQKPVENYTFTQIGDVPARLEDLFGDHNDLFVIHNMGRRCSYCTLWGDGINGVAHQIQRRAGLVLVSPDDPTAQAEFARDRGWTFAMASTADGGTFSRDMGFEDEQGRALPGVSAFHRDALDGTIVRTGCATFGPGDPFCIVFPLFELLKDGASGWQPE
ncbi:MAG: DUF899 family protein [Planctomycetota bacterium]